MEFGELNDEIAMRVIGLLSRKKWIERESDRIAKKCLHLLSLFNKEEQDLFIDLLECFHKIDHTDYLAAFIELISRMKCLEPIWFDTVKRIQVIPVLTKEDIENNMMKSSRYVWYLLKNYEFFDADILRKKNISYLDIGQKNRLNCIKKNATIFLVDDYIGSGDTVLNAIENLICNDVDEKNVVVLSIVAETEGIKRIKDKNIKIFFLEESFKGISESNIIPDNYKDAAMLLMRDIDDIIGGVKEPFRYGYNNSESLYSLIRTPNNTFPVFWKGKKTPFERR